MKLTPPKKWLFWLSVVLGVVGLIAYLVPIAFLSGIAFWLVLAGLVLLVLGLLIKGF